jgi:hypothetical protein
MSPAVNYTGQPEIKFDTPFSALYELHTQCSSYCVILSFYIGKNWKNTQLCDIILSEKRQSTSDEKFENLLICKVSSHNMGTFRAID